MRNHGRLLPFTLPSKSTPSTHLPCSRHYLRGYWPACTCPHRHQGTHGHWHRFTRDRKQGGKLGDACFPLVLPGDAQRSSCRAAPHYPSLPPPCAPLQVRFLFKQSLYRANQRYNFTVTAGNSAASAALAFTTPAAGV